MKIQLIRNATLRLDYAGHTILVDPYFAAKETLPSYAGRSKNPLVDLPCPIAEIINGVEGVVVSHLHTDHFDPSAQKLLPKSLPILCQPGDEAQIKEKGFDNVLPVTTRVVWNGLTIVRTAGRHGSSEGVLKDMGPVSGFVFQTADEPTVYWAGDTVWHDQVRAVIDGWQPEVIITHSGGARWGDDELIIMDAVQTVTVCQYAPESTVVAVHLEALDHCTTSRAALRDYARLAGIPDQQLLIPGDGSTLVNVGVDRL